eukprot:564674_1
MSQLCKVPLFCFRYCMGRYCNEWVYSLLSVAISIGRRCDEDNNFGGKHKEDWYCRFKTCGFVSFAIGSSLQLIRIWTPKWKQKSKISLEKQKLVCCVAIKVRSNGVYIEKKRNQICQ